jgi:hypothetical protein
MKHVFSIIVAVILFSTPIFAQQQQQVQTIKPTLVLSEIAFALQLLETIEMRGSEVDAMVAIKNVMVPPIVKANNEKKQGTEKVTLEFTIPQAQNLLTFLQRAKLTGASAERYKNFTDAIVASAQPKK